MTLTGLSEERKQKIKTLKVTKKKFFFHICVFSDFFSENLKFYVLTFYEPAFTF